MALLSIESGLELRITKGKGYLYLNGAIIPGQMNSTIRFERGSSGTMDVEISMVGVKVVHVEPKPAAHNHPLPEGFTAHDGSGTPSHLSPDTHVRVQYGNGDVETEEDSTKNPFTVKMWTDGDTYWTWSKPESYNIIAYKVEGK